MFTRKISVAGIICFLLCCAIEFQAQTVRINEIMASNSTTLADKDGDFPDWIELYNYGTEAVRLQSWALTDDINIPNKWVFPDTTLQANQYLIVFASSKNKKKSGAELHTNFNLKSSGEYLALMMPTAVVASAFQPAYPSARTDFSYGYFNSTNVEFRTPTPGKSNALSDGVVLPAPVFSHLHGYYTAGFELELTSPMANMQIYYTTDGSFPSKTNGSLYTTKISIPTTRIIRAVLVSALGESGNIGTNTYLFANDIIRQNNTPAGYPTSWGPYTAIAGTAIADYEMDQELLGDATYAETVKKSLTEIPTISIVTDRNHLFSKTIDDNTGGIYIYTGAPLTTTTYDTGRDWERPISVEFIDKAGSFQANCGVRLQGGHGRRPEKNPKHSFLLVFDSNYGPSKLEYPLFDANSSDVFENIILRAGFGNTWTHHDNAQRIKATYQEDIWTKDTQRAMGHPSGNSRHVHLFLNGLYWGIYAASERMDKEFGECYMGGDEDDYDVIKDYAEVSDGTIDAWNNLVSLANAGLDTKEKYLFVQGKNPDGSPNYTSESLVDVENLADYMLINFYGGNTDWDNHNWAAMRNRLNPGKGFKFMCWDAEIMFGSLTANILAENNPNCPSNIYQQLLKNSAFVRLMANRIQKHCFNGGVLTPESIIARWNTRKTFLENPIMAEAARWGDYRRDVHPYQTAGPFALYKKDTHWLTQQNYLINTYFPQRTTQFVTQLKTAGIFPTVDAPVYYLNNNSTHLSNVVVGDKLTMTAAQGTIYYTTNGSDPVDWETGTVNTKIAKSYSGAITIAQSMWVASRAYYGGKWSALNTRFYTVPANYSNIKITELHYNPLSEGLIDGSEFEFIELKNTGTATLDLGGMMFSDGISYEFPTETPIQPGEFIVLASNSNQFLARYKFRPFGTYSGKLDNSGERITLLSAIGSKVADFTYSNIGEWPLNANGLGNSLVSVAYNPVNFQTLPADWRASYKVAGSPGADDVPVAGLQNPNSSAANNVLLAQNYPNPFSEITNIDFQLPNPAIVNLSVYNLMGSKVATLINNTQSAGLHQINWNGCDSHGNKLENGIYFYKLELNNGKDSAVISRKMILKP